ncbi:MAG TPA: ATP-dependent DNA helicase RecQ, partial [Paludibacteraceae bacterium]|nr:ATP-dependent DNA helicase RecQ [Paludibacteraceae bacterium]
MQQYLDILKTYWGYDEFRPLQAEIIQSIASGRDTLGLMPTGGGKSLTFQVPALAMEGVCIVVTPLIALMKDQVENLKHKGISAAAIYSGMSHDEIMLALDNAVCEAYKFLYVSPERLATRIFIAKVRSMHVCMIAVDESHCISQWGYDFRPSYLKIADIREILPDVPVLALTATATPEVVDDIQNKLHFREKNVFRKSFHRSNLIYVVRTVENKEEYLLKILSSVSGTSVVYVRNRKKTKEIAGFLNDNGITAEHFHAGLKNETKDVRQARWKSGETRVIVATNAFGMGIDKPDVRTVVHMDLPDSIEAYFQEAGRAGRDEKKAYAILLFNKSDVTKLRKRVADTFPPKETVSQVYDAVGNYFEVAVGSGLDSTFVFDIADFCSKFHFPLLVAYNSIKILQQAGYLDLTDEQDSSSLVLFTVKKDE